MADNIIFSADVRAGENRVYWRASSRLRAIQRGELSHEHLDECLDDLEVIALHTDNPQLRAACQALVAATLADNDTAGSAQ